MSSRQKRATYMRMYGKDTKVSCAESTLAKVYKDVPAVQIKQHPKADRISWECTKVGLRHAF